MINHSETKFFRFTKRHPTHTHTVPHSKNIFTTVIEAVKMAVFDTKFAIIDFAWNLIDRKIIKFPHCANLPPLSNFVLQPKTKFFFPQIEEVISSYVKKNTDWDNSEELGIESRSYLLRMIHTKKPQMKLTMTVKGVIDFWELTKPFWENCLFLMFCEFVYKLWVLFYM